MFYCAVVPNINIRVSDEMLREVRLACAAAGKTQKDFVLELIRGAVSGAEPVKKSPAGDDRSGSGDTGGVHDVKSCRVYGCLRCKLEGVEDAQRGLK